jgi:hypothetical protein
VAFSWSVLGMLAMPFLLAGILGFLLWRASRAAPRGAGLDAATRDRVSNLGEGGGEP